MPKSNGRDPETWANVRESTAEERHLFAVAARAAIAAQAAGNFSETDRQYEAAKKILNDIWPPEKQDFSLDGVSAPLCVMGGFVMAFGVRPDTAKTLIEKQCAHW